MIEQYLGNPLILAVILFAATFVLEEAAILLAAGRAAAGEMSTGLALAAVAGGVVVSDWLLYGLGALAGRNRSIARWIAPAKLDQGRRLLARSTLGAGLLARLVPWLLFPLFVASGFLRVGFRRFALVNGAIALVYVLVFFFGTFQLFAVLLAWLGVWAWAFGAALLLAVVWGGPVVARRYFSAGDPPEG